MMIGVTDSTCGELPRMVKSPPLVSRFDSRSTTLNDPPLLAALRPEIVRNPYHDLGAGDADHLHLVAAQEHLERGRRNRNRR